MVFQVSLESKNKFETFWSNRLMTRDYVFVVDKITNRFFVVLHNVLLF